MIIHDMEGEIQIGDTFRKPKFRHGNRLQTFDRVVANPMWNQTEFKEKDYDADELDRFPKGGGYPGAKADWGWLQHILASLKEKGRAAVVLDTGAASRGSGNVNSNKETDVRRWFVEQDLIEGVDFPIRCGGKITAGHFSFIGIRVQFPICGISAFKRLQNIFAICSIIHRLGYTQRHVFQIDPLIQHFAKFARDRKDSQ